MDILLPIAAKSFLVAGCVLILLGLARSRSAAQRSWIAHLGLAAVLVLPIATLALPAIHVEPPAFLNQPIEPAGAPSPAATRAGSIAPEGSREGAAANFPGTGVATVGSAAVDWGLWVYVAPAGLLLLLTLIALARLFSLRARANVLIEPHWLTALARAQQRMGFKHGTALLTSDDLPSPISWGVMRPVILLNSAAADSHAEAEAIIAHELAHVASLDWAKLLLSRLTVALFWFNPLVWLLAREAHQLREEAADDAVLGADIVDTDYAQLLVGVARHECRGLLLGAHGVAPARNSLSRRVRRVLDARSVRAPVGPAFALGMFTGAVILAAPLAALTMAPREPVDTGKPYYASAATAAQSHVQTAAVAPVAPATAAAASPTVSGAFAASSAAIAGAASVAAHPHVRVEDDTVTVSPSGATVAKVDGRTVMTSPSGATISVSPPDSSGRQKVVMRAPNGAVTTYPDARRVPGLNIPGVAQRIRDRSVDDLIAIKAVGVTSDYVAAMRAASPALRHLEGSDMVALKATGVTPAYVREIGYYARIDPDELAAARAIGVTGDYVRSLAAAGFRGFTLDQLIQMRSVGVTAADLAAYKRSGARFSVDRVVDRKADSRDRDLDLEADQAGPGGDPG